MKRLKVKEQSELVTRIKGLKRKYRLQTLKKTLMQELKENNYEETEEILVNLKDELSHCIIVNP